MKPEHLLKLGFEFVKEYDHDNFHSKEFKKGFIIACITYKDGQYLTWNIEIEKIHFKWVSFPELKKLDKILNQK